MSVPARPPARRRMIRDQRGASAVEFALLAPLVFALVFSSFEIGWYMVQSMLLDHGLERAVRDVRLGRPDVMTQDGFKQRVCESASVLPGCDIDLIVEMTPIETVNDFPATGATCVDRTTDIEPVVEFNPGGRSETVYIRACLLVDPLVPGLGFGAHLDLDESGAARIVSHGAFENEPS